MCIHQRKCANVSDYCLHKYLMRCIVAVAYILVGIIPGVVILAVVGFIIAWCCCKRKKQVMHNENEVYVSY